jgi:hypothetical protein
MIMKNHYSLLHHNYFPSSKQLTKIVLAFYCLFFVISCHKSDNDYGLPNATEEGKGQFACVVNGEPYIAQNEYKELFFGLDPLVVSWDSPQSIISTFDIRKDNGVKNERQINLSVEVNNDLSVECFHIFYHDWRGSDSENKCYEYRIDTTAPYNIKITRYDPLGSRPRVLSGTFSCTVKEVDCGDLLDITDGRFDVKF